MIMPRSVYASKSFWQGTLERTISTVAQSAIASLSVDAVISGGLSAVHWGAVASVAGLAGLLTVLKALAAGQVTQTGPGFSDAEVMADKVVATESRSGVVIAGKALVTDEAGEDIPEGTPVDVTPNLRPEDDGADEPHEGLDAPPGFDDGTKPAA
jgi:hypothetical protein